MGRHTHVRDYAYKKGATRKAVVQVPMHDSKPDTDAHGVHAMERFSPGEDSTTCTTYGRASKGIDPRWAALKGYAI